MGVTTSRLGRYSARGLFRRCLGAVQNLYLFLPLPPAFMLWWNPVLMEGPAHTTDCKVSKQGGLATSVRCGGTVHGWPVWLIQIATHAMSCKVYGIVV
jgi:hypothetical protein